MLTLPNPAGGPAIVLKEMWQDYGKGVDSSRGPWVKRLFLADDWTQTSAAINALTGAGLLRPPLRCPESPNLYCLDAEAVPIGEYDLHDGGMPQWRAGMISATFAIPPYATSADQQNVPPQFPNDASDGASGPYLFMEQSLDWDTELFKLPDTSFTFPDGTPVDAPAFASVAVAEFIVVRKFQKALPFLNVTNYLNRLNAKPLFGVPKGQLQLKKVGTKLARMSDGSATADTTYRFKWKEVSHNMEFNPRTGKFDFILSKNTDTASQFKYKYANLGDVLQ